MTIDKQPDYLAEIDRLTQENFSLQNRVTDDAVTESILREQINDLKKENEELLAILKAVKKD